MHDQKVTSISLLKETEMGLETRIRTQYTVFGLRTYEIIAIVEQGSHTTMSGS